MVLVDVVQHLVVQRDEVLYLRLRDPVLGGRHVGQRVGHQHPTVLVLHSTQQVIKDSTRTSSRKAWTLSTQEAIDWTGFYVAGNGLDYALRHR